jgi:hypothetical protein
MIKYIILTCEKYHNTRLKVMLETWGKDSDSFLLEDIKFIQNLFSKINIKCSITQRNRIRFNKKETINYFNYIKDIKIQKEYEYKFGK